MSDNIHVAVRMRPLISREIESKASIHWNAQKLQKICQANSPAVAFHFDRVFQGHENNEVVYSEFCSPIVKSVIDGINGTIFAYGQTSSGKTFTMMGDDDGKALGVIHHTITDIFTFIQDMPEREFLLRVSYMEIYNEMVRDLLSDKNDKNENLKLHEDQYGLIKVSGLSEHIVQEADQVLALMRQAERKRRTGETRMNEKSSRSHSIFRMIIESGLKGESDAAVNVSQFNLVDLAGSERARSTGAKGARFKESININKSLLMLSQVISHLSEKVVNDQFINYRDSKLTRILQNSLGGNARTAIICTVTPACLDETLSTLKFAERAKSIKNKPEVNEVLTEQALLKQYANKIKKLTKELEETKVEKAQQNKSLQEQIQNLKKSYVFQIAPEIKSRSNRRETWGGCLDAARLRLDTLPPRKPLTSCDMSLEDDLLNKPKICVTPQRRLMPPFEERSSMPCPLRSHFMSSGLATLEEEAEVDTFAEEDESFSHSTRLSSRQSSCSAPPQSETISQTDFESPSLSTFQSEQIIKLKDRILFLEKELAELVDVTTLERQILRAKGRNSLDLDVSEANKSEHLNITHEITINADEANNSQLEVVEQQSFSECMNSSQPMISMATPECAEDSIFEAENNDIEEVSVPKSALPDIKMHSNQQEFNIDNEELYDYLRNTIKMLGVRKNIELISENNNLNSHYKVMLDMFNVIMQYQCLTFKGSFKTDLSEKIGEISFNLARIFQNLSINSTSDDVTEDLIEGFINETDGVLKEIEMFSLDADDGKHGILNQSVYNESFLQRHSFEDSVNNVSNARFTPLKTIAEDSINTSNEALSTTIDDHAALQFTNENALKECISTLEKDIEIYRKSVMDLQYDCELKDKQVSIFKDKLEIQENIIDGLKGELANISDKATNLDSDTIVTFSDSSSQTSQEPLSKNLSMDCSSQTIEELSDPLVPVSDGYKTCIFILSDNCSQTDEISNVAPITMSNLITFSDSYAQTLDKNHNDIDNCSQTDSVYILSNDILFTNSSCQTSEDFLLFEQNKSTVVYIDTSSQTTDLKIQLHSNLVSTEDIVRNDNAAVRPVNLLEDLLNIEERNDFNDVTSTNLSPSKSKVGSEDRRVSGDGDSKFQNNQESSEGSTQIIEKYEKMMKETQSQVDANLQVTLNDLLELRIFALEFMKIEMKNILGDVEFLENNASSPILDQIKIEVTALKELLVILKFYTKNQNEHSEYFNEVLEKNMLENGMLKEQVEQVELNLKEKDAEQMNLSKLLLDMDSSISELMRNLKKSAGQTYYVDCEEIRYPICDKNKSVVYTKLLQEKILSLGTLINSNTSLVSDLSVKLRESENKLKFMDLENEKKCQQSLKINKSVQTLADNRLLETSKKLEEAQFCLEDLKKEINSLTHKLEMMNNEKDVLEDKLRENNNTIEKMEADFESEKLSWSDNTIKCVKKVEEKCDQMMIEQENKFFDDIDQLKQEHREHILKRNEIHNMEQQQLQCKIKELREEHQTNMNEVRCKLSKEIKERYNEQFKHEEEMSALKKEIHNLTQLQACMKDKFQKFSAQVHQKLKGNKCIQTQTELLESNNSTLKVTAHTQTTTNNPIHASGGINANFEQCSHCKVLMQKIADLQSSIKLPNSDISKETELIKTLKKESHDLRKDMLAAKANNSNLIKENVSLKQELSSKLVLLRSCHCRLIPNPSSAVKDAANHLDKLEGSTQKKRKLTYEDNLKENKPSDFRKEMLTTDSADILKSEIVQRAIQEEARSLQMIALSNGSGPDGIIKCAYLNQKLRKKDKELEKKNKELEMLRKEQAKNAYSSKTHAGETMENQPLKDKKTVRPFHPFPEGAVPKLQPKKILKEVNRNDPTSNYDYEAKVPTPKKSNMGDIMHRAPVNVPSSDVLKMNRNNENKGNDREAEKRRQIEKLTGEVPECKQQ